MLHHKINENPLCQDTGKGSNDILKCIKLTCLENRGRGKQTGYHFFLSEYIRLNGKAHETILRSPCFMS